MSTVVENKDNMQQKAQNQSWPAMYRFVDGSSKAYNYSLQANVIISQGYTPLVRCQVNCLLWAFGCPLKFTYVTVRKRIACEFINSFPYDLTMKHFHICWLLSSMLTWNFIICFMSKLSSHPGLYVSFSLSTNFKTLSHLFQCHKVQV